MNLIPTVSIKDLATGASRELAANVDSRKGNPNVIACLLTNHRATKPHFGDNLFLSGGKYMVTVKLGNETTTSEISL